jgi:integrase
MATLRKLDGAWVIDWREANGKRHRDTLGRVGELPEREARRILKQRQLELSAGFQILNPPGGPTLQQFSSDYLKWHAAEYPASHQRIEQIVHDYLLPEFGFTPLDAIQPRAVEMWKHKRMAPDEEGAAKPQTVTKELRTLKAIINKAVQWGEITKSPILSVNAPRSLDSSPPRFYTVAELKLLYAACHAEVNGGAGPQPVPLHAAMWRLYANTGMRRMEGLMLRRAWVGREALKILSTDEERTKSGKWREIPLTDGALESLSELPKDGQYVLPRMTPPSLSRSCANDAYRAGLDGGLHTLRHTYISHMVMAGVPIRTVQKLAGHSAVHVTEKYAHLSPNHLGQAGRAISL